MITVRFVNLLHF